MTSSLFDVQTVCIAQCQGSKYYHPSTGPLTGPGKLVACFAEGCKQTSEFPVLCPGCKMGWEVGVCPEWCWSWCSRGHFCAAGCPTYNAVLLGHSQPAAKLLFAEHYAAGLGSGASEPCTVLGARLLLPWGFCGVWQMMPLQRQTHGAVAAPAWTQSVGSSSWLFHKQGFQSLPQFTKRCTCTCLIWKYGEDSKSQNVNSATCAILITYIRDGFVCKDFTLLNSGSKVTFRLFLKGRGNDKTKCICNIKYKEYGRSQNPKILRILRG